MTQFQQYRDGTLSVDGSVAAFYEREFYPFSNFSSFQVIWRGKLWPTSEHAYQAARYYEVQPDYYEQIRTLKSAHEAYDFMRNNREYERKDWQIEKRSIMKDIVRHKLSQHLYIQSKLAETGTAIIVEDSPVDSYWGWGNDRQGRNELGKIWMELREELRNDTIKQL